MPLLSKAKLLSEPREAACGIKEFVYHHIEGRGAEDGAEPAWLPAGTETLWGESHLQENPEPQKIYTEADLSAREQQAWEKGVQEASAGARESLERNMDAEREKLATALREFTRDREEYFRDVEAEVVLLVLAITRKVLHREAQVDPLLLTGVVRVALEKLGNSTNVKLRVPAVQADAWRSVVAHILDRNSAIEIIGDNTLKGPQCLIETGAGTTDISLERQMAEIECGFMDLLSQRPGQTSSELRVPSYAA